MSWIQCLYDTYNACESEIGKPVPQGRMPLCPLYHTTQQSHLEGAVDMEGNWIAGRGRVLSGKGERTTVIPCTEKFGARTSNLAPHPLFDQLKYMAGDYSLYDPSKENYYEDFLRVLGGWCESPYGHPVIRAIYEYLKKGTLIRDFTNDGLLYRAGDGTVPERWSGAKKEAPAIFQVISNQLKAVVRLRVLDGLEEVRPWEDPGIWKSWIDYQNSMEGEQDICYALGRRMPVTYLSPKNLRRSGDSAKLISSNNDTGFPYLGRFKTYKEAYCIGRETADKAHSALRWLISRQGYVNEEQVILAWNTKVRQPPASLVVLDSLDFCDELDLAVLDRQEEPVLSTGEGFAGRLDKAIAGYKSSLEGWEKSSVIGLDSATPGRLSIFYYREFQAEDLIDRIARWHTSCTWRHTYREKQQGVTEKGKPIKVAAPFVGASSPGDIAEAAYGSRLDGKLKKSTVKRLLPCIIDGAALPGDIVYSAARRAAKGVVLDHAEAEKTMTVACALLRKFYNDKKHREVWTMGLITDLSGYTPQERRSYLMGRALAYAQKLEELAQRAAGNGVRATNAERYCMTLGQHPKRTWELIENKLHPYALRLASEKNQYHPLGAKYQRELNQVFDMLEDMHCFTNEPLDPVYLMGYRVQMEELQRELDKAMEEIKAKAVKKS